ncbi:hypothetical protein RRG08_065528, partial [Elysia crispata]
QENRVAEVRGRRVQGKEFSEGTTSIVTKVSILHALCHDVRAELHM